MSRNHTTSRIASHTEYVRSRYRCPGCGEVVPRDGDRVEGTLCVHCHN
ncbi:hypothetical protein [Haloplanus salilacus]